MPSAPHPDESSGSPLGSALFAIGVLGILSILGLIAGLIALAFVALVRDDNGGGDGGSGTASSALDISLSEFAIDGELSAPAGDVTLNIVNAGAIEHNVAVRELGVQSNNLQSRGVDTLTLGKLEPGTYERYCAIAGHAESGMVGGRWCRIGHSRQRRRPSDRTILAGEFTPPAGHRLHSGERRRRHDRCRYGLRAHRARDTGVRRVGRSTGRRPVSRTGT